jgi:hypothetical protein
MKTPDLSMESAKQDFESLLYDPHMLKLREIVQRKPKHIFSIIGRESHELTFSRTLKYFLDPNEDHQLGSKVLRKFLHAALDSDAKFYSSAGISRLDIDLLDLDNANVFREYRILQYGILDIFVDIPKELAVIIEVKIHSDEGESQTIGYENWARKHLVGYKRVIRVFLSPTGVTPESPTFSIINFTDLHGALRECDHDLNSRDRLLFENFIHWINELMPMDPEVVKLCRNIYKKYRKTIDLIIENSPTFEAIYDDVAILVNKEHSEVLAHPRRTWITFSPKSWMDQLSPKDTNYSLPRLEYVSSKETQKMVLVFPQVGPMYDKIREKWVKIFPNSAEDAPFGSYNKDGNLYLLLEPVESIIPAGIGSSWDDQVTRLAKRAIEETKRIAGILTPEYLLGVGSEQTNVDN